SAAQQTPSISPGYRRDIMAIKTVPVTDATSASQQVNFFEESDGSLTPVARLSGGDQLPVNPLGTTFNLIKVFGGLAAGVSEEIYTTSDPWVIEHLEFATSGASSQQLKILIGGTASLGIVNYDGSTVPAISADSINLHGSALWSLLHYDTVN